MSSRGAPAEDPGTPAPWVKAYTKALRGAPLPVIEHGTDLRVTGWNDAAEEAFGYTREEAVGRNLTELILRGGGEEAWRRLSREGGEAPLECARKDGSSIRYALRWEPILDEQGEPVGAICVGQGATPEAHAAELPHTTRLLRVLMDNLPLCVWATDAQGLITYHEGKGLAAAGLAPKQFLGLNAFELYKGNEIALAPLRKALAGEPSHDFTEAHGVHWENWVFPVKDERSEITAVVGVSLDITQNTNVEQELRAQLDLVERQQRVIRELSTPIIEVWEKVLTLPMVGMIDSARTAQVMDSLLEAVVRTRARFAVLDLTGVEAVDTKTAAYLIELVHAIRLLGAEGIITGIHPTVAQTIVALGLDLGSIITLSNLRAGLRHCIAEMSRESGRAAAPTPGHDAPNPTERDPARAHGRARGR